MTMVSAQVEEKSKRLQRARSETKVRSGVAFEFREFRSSTTGRRNVAARDARAPRARRLRDVSTSPPARVFLGRMGFRTLRASFSKRASQGDSNGPTEVVPRGSLGSIHRGGGRTSGMCDAPTDDADAPRVSPDGSQLVHVDCERCRSRLEVRVPLAFQLAGRGHRPLRGLRDAAPVAVPPSPRSTRHSLGLAGLSAYTPPRRVSAPPPVEDDHSRPTTAPSDAAHRVGMPPRSHDEQRRHMQLARWHMNMAQRHSPPLGSLDVESFFRRPHLRRCRRRDHVDQLLRQAAHDFGRGEAANAADAARPKAFAPGRKPREPSSYNVFIREEIPRLKQKDPSLNRRASRRRLETGRTRL